jgi:transcriptional regulator with XRE-family HTH domain
MQINEKIKFIRELKGWSQEKMAEKLNMSVGGYANIEHGETNIKFSRLEQISKILGLKVSQLTDLDEKNFQIFLAGNDNIENKITIYSSDISLQHKVDKQEQEIIYLKKEVSYLKEIIEFMKKS